MNRIVILIAISTLLSSCAKNILHVSVSNPSSFDRNEELVELLGISDRLNVSSGQKYIVINDKGDTLPSQLTYDGKLIFRPSLKANSTLKYTIAIGAATSYDALVFGRHFSERYGDFAWENDKVGFRFYGKALKEIQAPTNGLDLWYKRTNRMVLQDWYRDNISGKASYHVDHGEGCDPYGVGTTLGAGAMAPYIDGLLIRNENYESYEVLDNGPLRITAKLTYPKLKIGDKEIEDTRIVSLDAASQYTKITQSYGNAKFAVAAGIVKRANGDSIIVSDRKTNLIYAEPIDVKNGQIYLGLIFPKGFDRNEINTYQIEKNTYSHILAISNYEGVPITYYTGFGWNKFGFDDISAFQDYTIQYIDELNLELKIDIE